MARIGSFNSGVNSIYANDRIVRHPCDASHTNQINSLRFYESSLFRSTVFDRTFRGVCQGLVTAHAQIRKGRRERIGP